MCGGKGCKSKAAENLPEYGVETKAPHVRVSVTLAGERGLPKKWSFGGSSLAKSQIFIHRNSVSSSYCFTEHNEELKCVWLPITDPASLYRCESPKPKSSIF